MPIVAVTAQVLDGRVIGVDPIFDEVIAKPFKFEQITDVVGMAAHARSIARPRLVAVS